MYRSVRSRREVLAGAARGALALGAGSSLTGCSLLGNGNGQKPRHRFRLGLDTYMLHRTLTAKDPALRKDLWWVVDQLDELGLTGLQIDPSHYDLLPATDPEALDRLEKITTARGYYVEFGMGGWDPDRMVERIRLTERFGGKALRTFCGHEGTSQEDIRKYIGWAAPALREAAERTDGSPVAIAVENHGDFVSAQLKELVDRSDHPRVGVCLDTGNSLFRKEDPITCARVLAPHATSMHLKDWFMTHTADGTPEWTEAVLGEGEVPVADILRIVVRYHPDLYIALESPARPRPSEAETVKREWKHLVASAAAAHDILARL